MLEKMIKCYLGLLIFFAVQHQVSSLSADVEHRKHTQNIRKDRIDMMKELQNVQRRSEIRQDPIDNYYDLIVTEPSESQIKPALRHRHGHHKLRSGRGARVTMKHDNTLKPLKNANTLRKNFNLTGETNNTQIQGDKNATTKNYLNENQRGEKDVASTHIQNDKDAATENDLNEHRSGRENEAATLIQKDKNATMRTYPNENRKGEEKVAKTPTQEDKNATTKNHFYESPIGRQSEATTQIKEDKVTTTTNYLIENWRREKVVTTSQKPVKKRQQVTTKVPFYRRVNYLNDQERNKPQKWVHCLDLVGPRLKGYKDNWRPIEKTNRHADIKRLAELLNTDVSQYTEAEIISLLSQISNIDLRIFQWDYTALTTIINIIIRGTIHSFKTLKSGVKYMFARWHLDTSMLKTFLEQTRIFRPPCLDISGTSGYTKKAGGILLFTKPDKSTKKHRGGDESCHSREITTVNNNNY